MLENTSTNVKKISFSLLYLTLVTSCIIGPFLCYHLFNLILYLVLLHGCLGKSALKLFVLLNIVVYCVKKCSLYKVKYFSKVGLIFENVLPVAVTEDYYLLGLKYT